MRYRIRLFPASLRSAQLSLGYSARIKYSKVTLLALLLFGESASHLFSLSTHESCLLQSESRPQLLAPAILRDIHDFSTNTIAQRSRHDGGHTDGGNADGSRDAL